MTNESVFHEGELAVQNRAGVSSEAARLEGMLGPASLGGGIAMFLAGQSFAVLVAHDRSGRLWASPLTGDPGFLAGLGERLDVRSLPTGEDPLADLQAEQPAALIAVDLPRRRRVRVNGWISRVDGGGLALDVAEAYGNCPAYIQQRTVTSTAPVVHAQDTAVLTPEGVLTFEAARMVRAADTFFLGTQHPERGADASHKGGNPGFVRVSGADILWPDYAGNNMFNSMGNLVADPSAAMLFIDFSTGTVLQLSGIAEVQWLPADPQAGDASTGRWVRFTAEAGQLMSSGMRATSPPVMSRDNPEVKPPA